MKLYNIKLRVISVQYSSLTIKSTPHLLINIVNRDYPLYEIESGLNHMWIWLQTKLSYWKFWPNASPPDDVKTEI